mgnify:CR=1 FL=1
MNGINRQQKEVLFKDIFILIVIKTYVTSTRTWCANDDVDALAEPRLLALLVLAAQQRRGNDPIVGLRDLLPHLLDLQRKLTRWREHESLGAGVASPPLVALLLWPRRQVLDDGQQEREGLAGARLRLHKTVAREPAAAQRRQCKGLDDCGAREADAVEVRAELLSEAERAETGLAATLTSAASAGRVIAVSSSRKAGGGGGGGGERGRVGEDATGRGGARDGRGRGAAGDACLVCGRGARQGLRSNGARVPGRRARRNGRARRRGSRGRVGAARRGGHGGGALRGKVGQRVERGRDDCGAEQVRADVRLRHGGLVARLRAGLVALVVALGAAATAAEAVLAVAMAVVAVVVLVVGALVVAAGDVAALVKGTLGAVVVTVTGMGGRCLSGSGRCSGLGCARCEVEQHAARATAVAKWRHGHDIEQETGKE